MLYKQKSLLKLPEGFFFPEKFGILKKTLYGQITLSKNPPSSVPRGGFFYKSILTRAKLVAFTEELLEKSPRITYNICMNLCEKYPGEVSMWSNAKCKAKRENLSFAREWDKFADFLSDMGERPRGMSLLRKDKSLGFSKENCYWGFRGETHYSPDTRKKYPGAFRSWKAMWSRCRTPSYWKRDRYQDRGIKVCERWRIFENFVVDMGERPEGLSLDRLDNDKSYSPKNCRWATQSQQVANRSPKDRYWERGELTPKSRSTIQWRVKHLGMTLEQAENTPLRGSSACVCLETGKVYFSMAQAERELALPHNSVSGACRRGHAVKGKYHFRYKNNSMGV